MITCGWSPSLCNTCSANCKACIRVPIREMNVRLLHRMTNYWKITELYYSALSISNKSDFGLSLDGLLNYQSLISDEDRAGVMEVITYLHSRMNEKFLLKLNEK